MEAFGNGPLSLALLVIGVGFFIANLVVMADAWRFGRRRRTALLTWRPPRPGTQWLYGLTAVGLAGLLFYKLVILDWPASAVFGEGMMFLYYAVWQPLSLTFERGLYRDGIALDRGWAPYPSVTGLTWKDTPTPTLIVVQGHRQRAGHLTVPGAHLAEVRRLLRETIKDDRVHMRPPLLDLGGHDRRNDV